MPDFSLCYYDYCTKPEVCQRSPKSGTEVSPYQAWGIFINVGDKDRKITETCAYFIPVNGYGSE